MPAGVSECSRWREVTPRPPPPPLCSSAPKPCVSCSGDEGLIEGMKRRRLWWWWLGGKMEFPALPLIPPTPPLPPLTPSSSSPTSHSFRISLFFFSFSLWAHFLFFDLHFLYDILFFFLLFLLRLFLLRFLFPINISLSVCLYFCYIIFFPAFPLLFSSSYFSSPPRRPPHLLLPLPDHSFLLFRCPLRLFVSRCTDRTGRRKEEGGRTEQVKKYLGFKIYNQQVKYHIL